MDQRRLGTSGLHVSALCLGMMSFGTPRPGRGWVLDEDAADEVVRLAVEAGVTFFDTADIYSGGSSEEVTGRLLTKYLSREELVVATKVHGPTTPGPNGRGNSRQHILAAVDASLGRLGLDHIDLYQVHRWDPLTPVEETMQALDDVVRAGKVRYLGASSMAAWQFAPAQHTAVLHGWTRFVSMQNQYNLLYREEEREMLPLCRETGVGVVPWSPLARGVLARGTLERTTARSREDAMLARYYSDAGDEAVLAVVRQVAAERGVPTAQVALAWLAGRPGVTAPVIGANRPAHLHDAVAALDLRLTPDEVARLEAPYRPHPVLDLAPFGAPVPALETSR
jgi:1-deoxyxylulose-5-phosphate synthase